MDEVSPSMSSVSCFHKGAVQGASRLPDFLPDARGSDRSPQRSDLLRVSGDWRETNEREGFSAIKAALLPRQQQGVRFIQ